MGGNKLLGQFDMIRIINLPNRTDRRREMESELKAVGLLNDPRVEFFNAIRPDDSANFYTRGAHGVFQSHLAILRDALSVHKSVLILEDDVDFSRQLRNYVLDGDWDIFYGGYEAAKPNDLQHSDIVGAHFMGFNKRIIGELVKFLTDIPADFPDIVNRPGGHPPIDGAYVWFRRHRPSVKAVFAEPVLGWQRPSPTDIAARHWLDEKPWARIPLLLMRLIKRRLSRQRHSS